MIKPLGKIPKRLVCCLLFFDCGGFVESVPYHCLNGKLPSRDPRVVFKVWFLTFFPPLVYSTPFCAIQLFKREPFGFDMIKKVPKSSSPVLDGLIVFGRPEDGVVEGLEAVELLSFFLPLFFSCPFETMFWFFAVELNKNSNGQTFFQTFLASICPMHFDWGFVAPQIQNELGMRQVDWSEQKVGAVVVVRYHALNESLFSTIHKGGDYSAKESHRLP